jgi:DNA-binding Lrp family transcriptional regulator
VEKAYILIGCELGSENDIVSKLSKMDKIKDARIVYGDYDIVVEVETETEAQMDSIITKKIRKIDKVRSTMTLGIVN